MTDQAALFPDHIVWTESDFLEHKTNQLETDVVASLVVNKDRILLIRRDIPGIESPWVFPAGKVEGGETIYDTAIREVAEETGIYCKPVRIISRRVHPNNDLKFAYVLCEYVNKAPDPRREFRIKWFKAIHIPKLMGGGMTKAVASAVGEIRRTRGIDHFKRQTRRPLSLL